LQGGLADVEQFHSFFPGNPFIFFCLMRGFDVISNLVDQFVKGGFFETNNLHKGWKFLFIRM